MSTGYTGIHSVDEPSETLWVDTGESRKFRYGYIVKKPTKLDFSSLEDSCQELIYLTDNVGDHVDNVREQIEKNLADFDANKDVFIPVGSAVVVFITGQILQRKLLENPRWDSYAMGIFLNGSYYFWRIHTDPEKESYEIILR